MNTSDLTYLLNKPEATNEKQTIALESVVLQFPYFQAARALHLKGLYNQDSFRYNYELKKTAAYTTDRTVLFEFITSESFMAIQQEKIDEIHKSIKEIEVYFEEELDSSSIKKSENLDLDVSEEIIKTPTNEIDVLYKKSLETLFLSAEHLIEETQEETEIDEIAAVQEDKINIIKLVALNEKKGMNADIFLVILNNIISANETERYAKYLDKLDNDKDGAIREIVSA